jgi:ArsR family transcriptional regulator
MVTLDQAASGFAAAGSDHRLTVLKALVKAGPEGLTVNEIKIRTNIAPSTLAHHLRTLKEGELIEQQKIGRSVINRAKFEHIKELASYLLDQCCVDSESTEC